LALEIISLMENLNKEIIFKKRKPELVEKKDPPIIIKIININESCSGVFCNDTPIFETQLTIDRKIIEKFISLSISKKKVKITIAR
tara:strand:+ start:184 stop:441 length:258 start_codon:yes stop_codon:yes gene_type:complete